jgi:hypothetical protein
LQHTRRFHISVTDFRWRYGSASPFGWCAPTTCRPAFGRHFGHASVPQAGLALRDSWRNEHPQAVEALHAGLQRAVDQVRAQPAADDGAAGRAADRLDRARDDLVRRR